MAKLTQSILEEVPMKLRGRGAGQTAGLLGTVIGPLVGRLFQTLSLQQVRNQGETVSILRAGSVPCNTLPIFWLPLKVNSGNPIVHSWDLFEIKLYVVPFPFLLKFLLLYF